MEQGTTLLIILVIIIFAVAAFSYSGAPHSPSANPPNPNAEFGVIHPRNSFFGSPSPAPTPTPSTPPTPPARLELLAKYITLSQRNAKQRDPKTEYIQITYSSSATLGAIDFTDWTISNSRGESYRIGQYTKLLGSTSIPNQDRLVVQKGAHINIITGSSPRGENFEANKCVAYFTQSYSFTPSLSYSCPPPNKEAGQEILNDACYLYVKNLSSCRTPSTLPINLNNQCRDYIASVASYASCVKLHKNDSDFYKNDYWIYLNRPTEAWSNVRESIVLRNEKGEVVKTITY